MIEPLSDNARAVLACIRDHPGNDAFQIAKMLAIDDALVRNEIAELLRRKLVIRIDLRYEADVASGKIDPHKLYYAA